MGKRLRTKGRDSILATVDQQGRGLDQPGPCGRERAPGRPPRDLAWLVRACAMFGWGGKLPPAAHGQRPGAGKSLFRRTGPFRPARLARRRSKDSLATAQPLLIGRLTGRNYTKVVNPARASAAPGRVSRRGSGKRAVPSRPGVNRAVGARSARHRSVRATDGKGLAGRPGSGSVSRWHRTTPTRHRRATGSPDSTPASHRST